MDSEELYVGEDTVRLVNQAKANKRKVCARNYCDKSFRIICNGK